MSEFQSESLTDAELRELEGVVEQHKTLIGISDAFGVFTSFCIPRLLTTIRNLQRENDRLVKDRDEARALLRDLNG